jgi:hypothetical protein
MHNPFVFSSIQPYLPVAIAVFFLFRVHVGKSPSPTFWWSMPHFSCCYKVSPLQGCWAGAATPAFSGQLVYLQFAWGSASLLLSGAQDTSPSLLRVFFFFNCLFIIQFGFFPFFPGQRSVCPGGLYWFVPGLSVEVQHAVYLLTCGSAKQVRIWHLAVWEPSWFLRLMWSGDAMCMLGVWRCQSFASSWWFFLPDVSPSSLQDFTLGSMLSASSL